MADGRDTRALGARLVIGAVAGMAATIAFTSTIERLRGDRARPRSRKSALETAAPFAFGALAGAFLAAANPRPSRLTGALAGGGLWLAGEMDWLPEMAVRPAGGGPAPRGAVMLCAHVAWGWAAAEAIRELSAD